MIGSFIINFSILQLSSSKRKMGSLIYINDWKLHHKLWYFVVGFIKEKDGFLGLYRGLGARLVSGVVANLVSNAVSAVS